MRSPQRFRAGADFRAWRIFSTFYRREEVRIPFPSHLGKTQTIPTHLFPVRGDDANVLGGQFGEALLSLCLKQHDEVVEQSVNLCYVEERRAVGLSLVLAHHPVEDQRETLMQDESEHTNASSFESTSFFFSPTVWHHFITNLFWETFPVAVGLALTLVGKHLQLIVIEQLVGNSQDGSV